MIKYQLPHTRFDHISDHKYDIYFNGKLFIKLLAEAVNRNTTFMFAKPVQLLFFLSMVSEVTAKKSSKQTLL